MKKIVSLLIALMMVTALLAGCSKADVAEQAVEAAVEASAAAEVAEVEAEAAVEEAVDEAVAEAAAQGYQLGVSIPSSEYTFFAQMQTELEAVYPKDGVEVAFYDGENNQEKQNKDVEDMITMGYDGIILIPITVEGAVPAIAYANEKGVPVITVDRQVEESAGVDVIGFVGSDHKPMGVQAAQLLIADLEKKFPDAEKWNVYELEGTQGASATILRGEGIHEEFAKEPRINLVKSLDADFSTTMALSIAEDLLTADENLNGFIGHNDDIACGCYQACVNANKVGKVSIVGIDGTLNACSIMADDQGIAGTVIQFPAMVCLGVETMVKYLNGEDIEYINYYPTEMIDLDHVQEYLDAGKPY